MLTLNGRHVIAFLFGQCGIRFREKHKNINVQPAVETAGTLLSCPASLAGKPSLASTISPFSLSSSTASTPSTPLPSTNR